MNYSQAIPPYEAVAEEYYDADRHPTCRNFSDLSHRFLLERIEDLAASAKLSLEIGAGKSIVAETFVKLKIPLSRLTILDQSASMLKHSNKWISSGAISKIADARWTEFPENYFDLIVSSLGDPYDCEDFWREVRRIIVDQGIFLFTTPSFEWSSKFRGAVQLNKAEFVLRDGEAVSVPSFTRPLTEHRNVMREFGFEIVEEVLPSIDDIIGPVSPKLSVLSKGTEEPVLYCFVLRAVTEVS
jgi:ubiquinone/menaquinone biosynthesis C-methylase UbiE